MATVLQISWWNDTLSVLLHSSLGGLLYPLHSYTFLQYIHQACIVTSYVPLVSPFHCICCNPWYKMTTNLIRQSLIWMTTNMLLCGNQHILKYFTGFIFHSLYGSLTHYILLLIYVNSSTIMINKLQAIMYHRNYYVPHIHVN